jgi:hypothetical protein
MSDECIGPCEWCGVVSHHLDRGECPQCRALSDNLPLNSRVTPIAPTLAWLREEPLSFEL